MYQASCANSQKKVLNSSAFSIKQSQAQFVVYKSKKDLKIT